MLRCRDQLVALSLPCVLKIRHSIQLVQIRSVEAGFHALEFERFGETDGPGEALIDQIVVSIK